MVHGGGKADGHKDMKDTLGGKGAGLAEMTNAGLPVPPGFTISTQACNFYYANHGKLTPAMKDWGSWPPALIHFGPLLALWAYRLWYWYLRPRAPAAA